MMSTKRELLILLSFYFREVLEKLKTYFRTNFHWRSVLHFVVHYSWIYKPLHDVVFTWRPRERHQHCISIQSSIYLGESFLQISCIWKIALTWILARIWGYLSPFISKILVIYWTVLTFLFDGVTVKTSSYLNNSGQLSRMSGHPQDVKKVSITRAGRIGECINTEFVWELRKTGFCESGCK